MSQENQFSADRLCGVRVVVTSNITVGTALVGSFGQAASLYRKGALTVEATNSRLFPMTLTLEEMIEILGGIAREGTKTAARIAAIKTLMETAPPEPDTDI